MKLWIHSDGQILEQRISRSGTTSIGRGEENKVVLKDRDISRFHCEIVADGDGVFELLDLNSTNGTFLNGTKIQQSTLVPGDTIQIGDTLMIVNTLHNDAAPIIAPPKRSNHARKTTRAPRSSDNETDLHEKPVRSNLRGRFHQLIVTTQRIAAELDNTKLLDVVLTGAARFAYATRGMVYLKNGDDYEFAVGYKLEESELEEAEKAFIEALTNRAEDQLDIVQHAFRVGDKRKISGHKSTARFEGVQSLIIPLVSPTQYDTKAHPSGPRNAPKVHGFIYLDNQSDPLHVDSSDRQLLKALAAQAAIALHNADLYQQATTDPGTGLLNRSAFKLLLRRELAQARKQDNGLAVAMIDLDFFKTVNDSHGHPYGDVVLKEFADILNEHKREGDLVGRYGGEEFILCLPRIYPADARHLFETLRGEVARKRFGSKNIKVTCSIGLACFPSHAKTSDLLIKHADQALYAAKTGGRDTVVSWSGDLDRIGKLQNPTSGFLTGNAARDQRFLDLFFQVSQRLTSQLPTEDTFRSLTESILDVIRADALSLFVGTSLETQRELLKVERSQNLSLSSPEERLSLVRQAIQEEKTVVSADFAPASGVFPSYSELQKGKKARCQRSMCIPLVAYQQICGAFVLEFTQDEKTYCSADLNFLEALSRQIALSLHFYHGAEPAK